MNLDLIGSQVQQNNSFVEEFPYNELPNVSPLDHEHIRKILPYLLQISQNPSFYTNFKAVKLTANFIIKTLYEFDNTFLKDVFVGLLQLLKQIFLSVTSTKQLTGIFSNLKQILDILFYVSDFDSFCNFCANICQPILERIINSIIKNYDSFDQTLYSILQNYKNVEAFRELTSLAELVVLRFPSSTQIHLFCAEFLMENCLLLLRNWNKNNDDLPYLNEVLTGVLNYLLHPTQNPMTDVLKKFLKYLMPMTPKLIYLCGHETIELVSKKLLAWFLHMFIAEHGGNSHEMLTTIQGLHHLPSDYRNWPKSISETFFWLCYLLYYHHSYVWRGDEICSAISSLIYSKKSQHALNTHILKAVLYIFPICIQDVKKVWKARYIGQDLLGSLLPTFTSFLGKIISFSEPQLLWILCKGSDDLKIEVIKVCMKKINDENIQVLENVLAASKSEGILIKILLREEKFKTPISPTLLQIIQRLQNRMSFKNIPLLISKFCGNVDIVCTLLRTGCNEVPQDFQVSLSLLSSLNIIIHTNPNEETLTNLCFITEKIFDILKSDKNILDWFIADQFWMRYLIMRLNGGNEKLMISILMLLTKILTNQTEETEISKGIFIDVSPFLTGSPQLIVSTIRFIKQILRLKNSLITLKIDSVRPTFSKLCHLTDKFYAIEEVFYCLRKLLRHYPDLTYLPHVGMIVEEKCHYSNRRKYGREYLEYLLIWITLIFKNPDKNLCYLPPYVILVKYIQQSIALSTELKNKYLNYLSHIYDKEVYLNKTEADWQNINLMPVCLSFKTNIKVEVKGSVN
ncbi:hypothetical protein ABEB36_002435 [Hypothenemus hampei]|uniref:Uncharacterized protein n=1 Tax=Hypothenemus hampei TaxID=57062 RepID=A0ABD1F5Q8_HYPHA